MLQIWELEPNWKLLPRYTSSATTILARKTLLVITMVSGQSVNLYFCQNIHNPFAMFWFLIFLKGGVASHSIHPSPTPLNPHLVLLGDIIFWSLLETEDMTFARDVFDRGQPDLIKSTRHAKVLYLDKAIWFVDKRYVAVRLRGLCGRGELQSSWNKAKIRHYLRRRTIWGSTATS